MREERVLILERTDLFDCFKDKKISLIDFSDFVISFNLTCEQSLILFIDDNGETRILKNRFGY